MLKKGFVAVFKIIALVFLAAFITLLISAVVASPAAEAADPAQAGASLVGIFIVALADVLVLLGVIKLSCWAGLALISGLAFSYFGVKTFLGQIEALAFLTPVAEELGSGSVPVIAMPVEIIVMQFLIGIALALIVVPLAVRLVGKHRSSAGETRPRLVLGMSAWQWFWKLLAVIAVYELLYFGFGYFVAWQNPAVVEFYQGTNPESFLAALQNIATSTPLLIALQALRALLWAAFALPVILMLRDRPWIGALATAIFLAIPMNVQHIIPNPFMLAEVRMAHFIETASSNFILGAFLFWNLHRRHHSLVGLFRVSQARREEVESQAA